MHWDNFHVSAFITTQIGSVLSDSSATLACSGQNAH